MTQKAKVGYASQELKILYVCPLAHIDGHPYQSALAETEALSGAGHEVTLLTFAGLAGGEPHPKVKHVSVLRPNPQLSRRLKMLSKGKSSGQFLRSLAFLLTMLKAVQVNNRLRSDVIHLRDGTGLFMSLPQALGILFKGQRWCISLLLNERYPGLLGAVVDATKSERLYRVSLSRSAYAYVCQNKDLISYYSAEFLGGVLAGKVSLLPLMISNPVKIPPRAVQQARSRLGIPDASPVLLSFGALHHGKDIETVLGATSTLPSIFLVHAGITNGRLKEAGNRPPFRKIVVHDFLINESLKNTYFEAASCVILSYTRGFSGTASMLWEACRFQLPVIASDNKQLAELVTGYGLGLVFKAGSVGSLRACIIDFLSLAPEQLTAMKDNCQRFCEDFSSTKWAKKCDEIYDGLQASVTSPANA